MADADQQGNAIRFSPSACLNAVLIQVFRYTSSRDSSTTWKVQASTSASSPSSTVHIVDMPVDGSCAPSCSCPDFTTCHIPCRHIGAVCVALNDDPMNVSDVVVWNSFFCKLIFCTIRSSIWKADGDSIITLFTSWHKLAAILSTIRRPLT